MWYDDEKVCQKCGDDSTVKVWQGRDYRQWDCALCGVENTEIIDEDLEEYTARESEYDAIRKGED